MNAVAEQRWKVTGASVAVALLLVIIGVRLAAEEPSRIVTAPGNLDPAEPLAGGVAMSLSEATAAFPVPIYRPDVALGSDSTLTNLWVRTDDPPEAYLEYGSGLVVLVRPAETGQPTKEFAEAQVKDGVPGTIVTIDGVDAFLVPQSDAGAGNVRLVMGGTIVTAIGDRGDFTVPDLQSIADSIVNTAARVQAAS
jgi:hypothetical protein